MANKEKQLPGFEGFILDASLIKVSTVSQKMLDQVRSYDSRLSNHVEEMKEGFKVVGNVGGYLVLLYLTKKGQFRKIHYTEWKDFLKQIFPELTEDQYNASFKFDDLTQIFLK